MHGRLKVREASRGKFVHLFCIEAVTHSYLKCSRDHRHVLAGRKIQRREVVHPVPDPSGSHPAYTFLHAQLISARQDSRRQLTRATLFQLISWSNLRAIVKLRRIEQEEALEPLCPIGLKYRRPPCSL